MLRRGEEIKICGQHAAQALFAARAKDIIRVYVTEKSLPQWSALLKYCAAHKRAYHIVAPDELSRIAESTHHEDICVLAKRAAKLTLEQLLERKKVSETSCFLLLEDVKNPHNIGAILRVAAHFGVDGLILCAEEGFNLPAASHRIAEGGAEAVPVVPVKDVRWALGALKKRGFVTIGTSGHAAESVYGYELPRRAVFLFGSEGQGLRKETLAKLDCKVVIPGSGRVESLNVACATTAVLGEFWRQHLCNAN